MTTLADDPLVAEMKRCGVAVTRDNYIIWNWGASVPDVWTADEEEQIPEELQDWSEVVVPSPPLAPEPP